MFKGLLGKLQEFWQKLKVSQTLSWEYVVAEKRPKKPVV